MAPPSWFCSDCKSTHGQIRYNPFRDLISSGVDKDAICADFVKAGGILNDCSTLDNINHLNCILRSNPKTNPPENFSVFFNNIDGNQSNFNSLSIDLDRHDCKFSAITLCETNCDSPSKDLYHLQGYESIYQSKITGKSKGSGLAIYIKNNFMFVDIPKLSRSTPDIEALFVEIANPGNPITLGVVYRPPSGNADNFINEFHRLLSALPKKNAFVTGDFNLNLHSASNSHVRNFENCFITNGFAPAISVWTHQQPHCSRTCIDNILSNSFDNITCSYTINEPISHHLPLICLTDLSSSNIDPVPTTLHRYDFCIANVLELQRHTSVLVTNNHDLETFIDKFSDIVDDTCKEEVSSSSKKNTLINPWITPGLIISIKTKDRLYKKWKKSCYRKNPKGDHNLYLHYKNYRGRLKYSIKMAKAKYYTGKFNDVEGNPKATWKLINNLRGLHKSDLKPSFIIDGKVVLEHRVIANSFNNYFVSIAEKLNSELDPSEGIAISPIPDFTSYFSKTCRNSIHLPDCDAKEVEDIIKAFASGKASDIPVLALKSTSSIISPSLSHHFNTLMQQGHFPEKLKTGRISPIYKNKGSKQHFDNYRPISTLPIFGKIFEKLIYSRLYNFLMNNNLMYSKQFGFRKGHSTSHALNYSINHLTSSLADKKHVIGIFIDLSKAFDTISHDKLLHKLSNYGIRGNAHDLLNSYLTGRSQYTKFLNESSDKTLVKFGVPQGSVLGPLLFLIYVNDIINCSLDGEFVLYADDTNIFVVGSTREEVFSKANLIIQRVHDYMKSNLLHINLSKCLFMYFKPDLYSRSTCLRTQPFSQTLHLKLNGVKLKQVSSTKFLGVTIDENLTWEQHMDTLVRKLASAHGALYRIKDYIPKALHKQLYHALFESHLVYGISVWGSQSHTALNKLFTLQKKCIRMLFGNPTLKKPSPSSQQLYCYCKYGESGIMIECEKCGEWFHDECLGLSESEINNILNFYCIECLNKNSSLSLTFKVPPAATSLHCYCNEKEYDRMFECGKCRLWFHSGCIELTDQEISLLRLFFCTGCLNQHQGLKLVFKDPSDFALQHTKPIFKSHGILSVYNLYPYHILLELYKILKFRLPYCLFDIFQNTSPTRPNHGLCLSVPKTSFDFQRSTFVYQSTICWNWIYKKLITPFNVTLHKNSKMKGDSSSVSTVNYDFSNSVSSFKLRLRDYLTKAQHSPNSGDDWKTCDSLLHSNPS